MFFNKKSAEEKMIESAVKNLGYSREIVVQAIDNIRENCQQITATNLMIECGLVQNKKAQQENDRKFFGIGD